MDLARRLAATPVAWAGLVLAVLGGALILLARRIAPI